MAPEIKYAKSGEVSVAYEVIGDGPIDLIMAPGFVSHLEISWENPGIKRFAERLAKFARVITFDKRGTGMSDPVDDVPTLEDRMDDIRAVMDAAGSEKAVLVGISEGAAMCILFAAAHPERTTALVLYGGTARSTWAPDYPWATTQEALMEALAEFTIPSLGTGDNLDTFAPSLADDPAMRAWWGRMERFAASPSMMAKVFAMFLEIDVRDALPSVHVPTLVLHRKGDRVVNIGAGRYIAEHIEGAKLVELEGRDHAGWAGDVDSIIGEIEEFVTGARGVADTDLDRVLAKVMFVDLVGSTARAAELGDQRWRDLLDRYYVVVRRGLERFRGREIKAIGDGFLCLFDGPARAIRAAQSIASGVRELGLEVRTGLHTGECELIGDDVGGIAVHIGARVVAIADPGEVLVSSTVKDLVAGSGIEFADRGAHTLKGVPGEWHLFSASA
jgi:pimeloyl-ACP methyl ester carboxylesterase